MKSNKKTEPISKVYIVNDAYKHNYDDAKPFGKPVKVTVGNVQVWDIRIMWDIREAMKDYGPNDYVLLSGHAILCFYVMAEAFRHVHELKILIWGAKDASYRVISISRKFWEYFGSEEEQWQEGETPEQH